MRFKSHLLRRSATAVGAVALSLGGLALIGGPPAGASGGPNPPTSSVTYEVDAWSPLAFSVEGQGDIPLIVGTAGLQATDSGGNPIDTSKNPLYPQGSNFGVSGDVTYTALGQILAGLLANSQPLTFSVQGFQLAGDKTVTGTYPIPAFTGTFNPTVTSIGASWTSGTGFSTVTAAAGTFSQNDLGGAFEELSGSVELVSADGSQATLSSAQTPATGSGTVTLVDKGTLVEQINTPTSPQNFQTNAGSSWPGDHNVTGDILLDANPSSTIGYSIGALTAGSIGSQSNVPAVITGYLGANHGPAVVNSTGTAGVVSWTATPALPQGTTTALQALDTTAQTLTTPDSVSVQLDGTPTANDQNVNLGVGASKTVTVSGSAITPGTITSYALVSTPPLTDNGNSLTFSLVGNQLTLDDTKTPNLTVATIVVQFTVTDDIGVTSAPGSVTVTIGTPPVDQPLSQNVIPGQLVLSCNAPGAAGYPLTTCPTIDLPDVTLNGLNHSNNKAINTIYVSDNRGDPSVGWSLSTYMVPTSTNTGEGGACSTYVGFCASLDASGQPTTLAYNTVNGKIPATDLSIGGVSVATTAGTNTAPTGSGGTYGGPNPPGIGLATATAGFSGGTFSVNGSFNINVPASVYAGTYLGTVEYLVQ